MRRPAVARDVDQVGERPYGPPRFAHQSLPLRGPPEVPMEHPTPRAFRKTSAGRCAAAETPVPEAEPPSGRPRARLRRARAAVWNGRAHNRTHQPSRQRARNAGYSATRLHPSIRNHSGVEKLRVTEREVGAVPGRSTESVTESARHAVPRRSPSNRLSSVSLADRDGERGDAVRRGSTVQPGPPQLPRQCERVATPRASF